MATPLLPRDLIPQPRLWRCVLDVSARSLGVLLLPPVAGERPVGRSIPLAGGDGEERLKALQEAVYDNPLLLEEFASTEAFVDAPGVILVPAPLAEAVEPEALLTGAAIDCGATMTALSNDCGGAVAAVYALPRAEETFLRRTFFNVGIGHRLTPAVSAALSAADGPAALTAAIEPGRVTVTATAGGKLTGANTFVSDCAEDTAYYILAFDKVIGGGDCAITLAGGGGTAAAVASLLGRAGREAAIAPAPLQALRADTAGTPLSYPLTLKLADQ